jgi:EpsI family protein
MNTATVSRPGFSQIAWSFGVAALLVCAWAAAVALKPVSTVDMNDVDFDRQVPTSFGEWREVKTGMVQVPLSEEDLGSVFAPYDKVLSRVYRRPDGQIVMLALAWGSRQRQDVKIHWPELCYTVQGFRVQERIRSSIDVAPGASIPVTRLVTQNSSRYELVVYWVRIGDSIPFNSWQSRGEILLEGLKGRVRDGILVRASQPLADASDAGKSFALQERFLQELLANVDAKTRKLLAGR